LPNFTHHPAAAAAELGVEHLHVLAEGAVPGLAAQLVEGGRRAPGRAVGLQAVEAG